MNTKSFARPLSVLLSSLAALAALAMTGCASPAPDDASQYLAPGQRPSTMPWNTPASWEGKGQLGGTLTGAQAQGTLTGTGAH